MVAKGKILVVDDEINLCRILGAKLSKNGYNVETVHDGLTAVEKVRESDFDVVLLDLILPKLDGLSALAEIRNFNSSLPVIVMTACENPDFELTAKKHGISAFIYKPFELQNVVSLISDLSYKDKKYDDCNEYSSILFNEDESVAIQLLNSSILDELKTTIDRKTDKLIQLKIPIVDSKHIQLELGEQVKVNLTSKGAFYTFTSTIIKINDDTFALEKPSMIHRIQRRKQKRCNTILPIKYVRGIKWEENTKPQYGFTHNISKSGICIEVNEKIDAGEILSIKIRPKIENDEINAIAEVLRSKKNEIENYILGCKFESVDNKIESVIEDT